MISRALVLAAGKSTRIASLSAGRAKPLMAVSGRPVIAWTLDWLAENGVTDAWVNLHYRPDDIRAALGDGGAFGLRIHYAYEAQVLGTAGAYRNLGANWQDMSLVVYGDNLMRFNVGEFELAHRDSGAMATVALFDPDRHANTRIAGGKVELDGAGWVRAFREGTAGGTQREFVNAGAYIVDPKMLGDIAPGFQDFGADAFPALVRRRELRGHVIDAAGYCLGLDTPASFRVAEDLISSKRVVLR